MTLRCLAAAQTFDSPAEVLRVICHRYVIGHYALGVLAVVVLHQVVLHEVSAMLELSISALSLIAFIAVSILYLRLWVRWAGVRDHVTVWMSPGFVVAAGAAHVVGMALDWTAAVRHDLPLPWWVAVAAIFVFAEAVAALACHRLVPRVQRSLRAGRVALAGLTAVKAAPPLMAGKVRIPVADILRVEASGNYVQVVTAQAQHVLPGPFMSVLAQLPEGAGHRVHRSHWVAMHAVHEVVRTAKGIRLITVTGDDVPVAQPLSPEVEAWLQPRWGAGMAKPPAVPGAGLAMALSLPPVGL